MHVTQNYSKTVYFRDNNILDLQRYNFLNKNECKEN